MTFAHFIVYLVLAMILAFLFEIIDLISHKIRKSCRDKKLLKAERSFQDLEGDD